MALQYGSSTSLACTSFNSLGSSSTAVASSAVGITSTTNNITDIMISVGVTVGAITPSATTLVYIYAYGSEDGLVYPGGQSGSVEVLGTDSAETLSSFGNNLKFLGSIMCHTASIQIVSNPMSLAAAFGGLLPRKWGIVVQNQSGVALAASGNFVKYTEVYYN